MAALVVFSWMDWTVPLWTSGRARWRLRLKGTERLQTHVGRTPQCSPAHQGLCSLCPHHLWRTLPIAVRATNTTSVQYNVTEVKIIDLFQIYHRAEQDQKKKHYCFKRTDYLLFIQFHLTLFSFHTVQLILLLSSFFYVTVIWLTQAKRKVRKHIWPLPNTVH